MLVGVDHFCRMVFILVDADVLQYWSMKRNRGHEDAVKQIGQNYKNVRTEKNRQCWPAWDRCRSTWAGCGLWSRPSQRGESGEGVRKVQPLPSYLLNHFFLALVLSVLTPRRSVLNIDAPWQGLTMCAARYLLARLAGQGGRALDRERDHTWVGLQGKHLGDRIIMFIW